MTIGKICNREVVYISPDVTVALGTDAIIASATRSRVPVFTSLPGNTKKGAAFEEMDVMDDE